VGRAYNYEEPNVRLKSLMEICLYATLNTPNSEGGTSSSHMHNLAKSQSYLGLKVLLSDPGFMKKINSMLISHRFQEN
jgi:hypothetical protein